MARRIVDVLLPVALDRPYLYRVPAGLALVPGDFVTVPLGRRAATAVVWADNPRPDPGLDNRIREVEDKLDIPPLKPELRRFVDWVRATLWLLAWNGAAHGPAQERHLGASRERIGVRLASGPDAAAIDRSAKSAACAARRRACASQEPGRTRRGRPPGVVDSLLAEGTLESPPPPPEPVAQRPDPDHLVPDLVPAQHAAAA